MRHSERVRLRVFGARAVVFRSDPCTQHRNTCKAKERASFVVVAQVFVLVVGFAFLPQRHRRCYEGHDGGEVNFVLSGISSRGKLRRRI